MPRKSTSNPTRSRSSHRAVIVGGVRTPFLRAFGAFTRTDTIALGTAAVRGLLRRYPLAWSEIDSVIWGSVIIPGQTPNVGREIALDAGLPPTVEATTMTRACTSSLYTATAAAAAIERGDADVVIAGGSDSASNAQVTMPPSFVHKVAPVIMSKRSGPADYARLATTLRPADVLPRQPAVRERSTGELMGESAERMAQRHGITREAQDRFAMQSHHRAAEAIASGRFADEIVTVDTPDGHHVGADDIVRGDTTMEALGKLRPAFARGGEGTLTAGNSSALTDGAAALLLMREDLARAHGLTPLARFASWSYGAVDPADQLLIGPAIAMPQALARAGMELSDIDLVDIHEAFAAQVLCVLKMLGSDAWGREVLGRDGAAGFVAPEAINIHGGSVSLGHPFAATGARMVSTMANELHVSGKRTALLGICGAGGLSAAALLERAD